MTTRSKRSNRLTSASRSTPVTPPPDRIAISLKTDCLTSIESILSGRKLNQRQQTDQAGPTAVSPGMPQRVQIRYNSMMKTSFEEVATAIWRQVLVENKAVVTLGGERYPVTRSRAKKLRQVVFEFDGESFIGIEQNPKTKSRWAAMARAGKKVMQFIQDGRYIAVVADGKVILYGKGRA